jgi:hypothetical protein
MDVHGDFGFVKVDAVFGCWMVGYCWSSFLQSDVSNVFQDHGGDVMAHLASPQEHGILQTPSFWVRSYLSFVDLNLAEYQVCWILKSLSYKNKPTLHKNTDTFEIKLW